MDIDSAVPVDFRDLLREERRQLVELLRSLRGEEWLTATACGGWSVKDVALHLLDADLGWLSRGRDEDLSGLIPMESDYRQFVAALDAKNQRWVEAARGLSPRVLIDLLQWAGEQVAAYHDSQRLIDPAGVAWAGGEAPGWLGMGRDFTERWVHQQQIREAVNQPGRHDLYLPAVLSVFIWAFPHQYRPDAEAGTVVNLDFGEKTRWHLVRLDSRWKLETGLGASPAASLITDADAAWRQLTGADVPANRLHLHGPEILTEPLLEVRGIIA